MSTHRNVSRRFIVHGRVQGVGFRYAASRTARRLGIVGWVRNRPEGTVELIAEGSSKSIQKLAAWLGSGPPGARVTRVEVDSLRSSDSYVDFRVEYF